MEIQRLNNPQNLKRDLLNLPITTHNGVKYRTFTQVSKLVDNGACQCYKDCNCSDRRGDVTISKITWYRQLRHDNTGKCFYLIPRNK